MSKWGALWGKAGSAGLLPCMCKAGALRNVQCPNGVRYGIFSRRGAEMLH